MSSKELMTIGKSGRWLWLHESCGRRSCNSTFLPISCQPQEKGRRLKVKRASPVLTAHDDLRRPARTLPKVKIQPRWNGGSTIQPLAGWKLLVGGVSCQPVGAAGTQSCQVRKHAKRARDKAE